MNVIGTLLGVLWVVIGVMAIFVMLKFARVLDEISAYLKEVKK